MSKLSGKSLLDTQRFKTSTDSEPTVQNVKLNSRERILAPVQTEGKGNRYFLLTEKIEPISIAS